MSFIALITHRLISLKFLKKNIGAKEYLKFKKVFLSFILTNGIHGTSTK